MYAIRSYYALAYCAAMHPFGISTRVSQLNVSRPDTRGGVLPPATGQATVTVDGDPPTTLVTVPANNSYVPGSTSAPTFVKIEGEASDPTSFISKVEVDTGSGWVEASGLEEWLAELEVTEGGYTVQARATDAVGNLGPVSPQSSFIRNNFV